MFTTNCKKVIKKQPKTYVSAKTNGRQTSSTHAYIFKILESYSLLYIDDYFMLGLYRHGLIHTCQDEAY